MAALQLAATPTTVDETATRQRNAAQLLDDDSLNPLFATDVTWSVASGPLTGIDASDDGDQRTITDPAASGTKKFYTVEIEKQ